MIVSNFHYFHASYDIVYLFCKQSCEPGYRRVDDIVYGGRCQPCQCHQHAEKCDPNTGKCIVS